MATVTKAIGSATRDYATVALWEADLDGTPYVSGDAAVGEMYNDSVFTISSSVVINGGGAVGLVSVTLQAASSERHDGTAGTGARIVASSGYSGQFVIFDYSASTPTLDLMAKWIEFDGNDQDIDVTVNAGAPLGGGLLSFDGSVTGNVTFANNILHSVANASHKAGIYFDSALANTYFAAINNIVYDIKKTTGSGNADVVGIWHNVGTMTDKIAYFINNTIYNTTNDAGTGDVYGLGGLAFDTNNTGLANIEATGNHFKNNIVVGTGGTSTGSQGDYPTYTTTTNISNNASSDATAQGTDSITTASASDFVRITPGSEDLHLVSSAVEIDQGTDLATTPANVNIDIDGRDRDAQADTWDMGADEFVSAGGGEPEPVNALAFGVNF